MPRGAYQVVIEGPAARLKDSKRTLAIEPGLTQRLLEDIEKGGGSDALPLLAFTLEQLYLEHGGGGTLKLADYESFGGIRGAIEAGVERALKAADADPRIPRDQAARMTLLHHGLIPWLAGIDLDTGSPRRRVARYSDIPPEAEPLIRLLVEQRLLSTDMVKVRKDDTESSEITVEPAHEALLRQWGLLRGWLEEDLAALTALESVKRASRDWAANAREADWLNHAGSRLEDAEKVATRPDLARDLSADAHDYLKACRARDEAEARERDEREQHERRMLTAERRARANRRFAFAFGTGFLIFAVVAIGASWLSMREQAERKRAQHAIEIASGATNKMITDTARKLRGIAREADYVASILLTAMALQEQLIAIGDAGPQLRYDMAVALNETSETLQPLNPQEALAAAQKARSVLQALLAEDRDNLQWQRDLVTSHNRIGDVLFDQGKFDVSFAAFNDGLETMRTLAARDVSNVEWQHDLAVSLDRVAGALAAQNDIGAAFAKYRECVEIRHRLVQVNPANEAWSNERKSTLTIIGQLAYRFILARQFDKALEAVDLTRSYVPDWKWVYAYRAHALMMLGRTQEAETVYLQFRGVVMGPGKTSNDRDRIWEDTIRDDFEMMRNEGLSDPLMGKIEQQFRPLG